MKKCVWCNRSGGELKAIKLTVWNSFATAQREVTLNVHPQHEQQARKLSQRRLRFARLFLLAILSLSAIALVTVLIAPTVTSVSLVLMGVVFIVLPFVTDETINLMGMRSGMWLARAGGAIFIVMGLATGLSFVLTGV